MKKLVILLLLNAIYFGCLGQQKGDSLAILYYQVYAYKNPADLSTRYSKTPFSYYNKNKLIFIAKIDEYPKYLQVKTVGGDTIFVKEELVSADQNLTHSQIKQEVNEGKRKRSPDEKMDLTKLDIPQWAFWLSWAVFLLLLYLFWKHFSRFDRWFCNKAWPRGKPLTGAWFIKFSTFAGFAAGSIQLFSSKEFDWFMQEGMQIWGSYPSRWDWVMWSSFVATATVALLSVLQAFKRFSLKYALIYSVISLLLVFIYFVAGLIVSVFVIVIYFLANMGGSSSSSGSTGGYTKSSGSVGNDPSPVGTVKYDYDGQRYIKNTAGSWEKKDSIL